MRFINKHKNQYQIEVANEQAVRAKVKATKSRSSFSPMKKIITTLVAAAIMLPATLIGVSALPDPARQDAHAADFFTNMVCGGPGNLTAIYGGSSPASTKAEGRTVENRAADTGKGPYGGGIPVSGAPKALAELLPKNKTTSLKEEVTMLERYGYFAPNFTSWHSTAAMKEGEEGNPFNGTPFFGSGGSSALGQVGPGVVIKNPTASPFLASNVGGCLTGITPTVANIIMLAPKLGIAVASMLYMATTDLSLTGDSILAPIGDVIETLILGDGKNKGLKDLLFLDFMLVAVMFGGLIVAWQGLGKGQTMQAIQSVGWIILVAITGMLFLSKPLFLSDVMEKGMNTIETAIEEATLQTSSQAPECDLPSGVEDATARKVTCSLWLNSIYKPWIAGQFGKDYDAIIAEGDSNPSIVSGVTEAVPQDKLGDAVKYYVALEEDGKRSNALKASIEKSSLATTDNRGVFDIMEKEQPLGTKDLKAPEFRNWAFYQVHTQSNWDQATGVNYGEIAFNQLALKNNEGWKSASEGIFNSLLSFLATAAPSSFLIVISGSLISFQLILVILLILAPFFFVLGIFPGWGRRILARWAELLTSLFVKRVILALFLFIFLKIYISILAMDISWVYQILFITLLTFVALTQKNTISDMVTSQINFGSGSIAGDENTMKHNAIMAIQRGKHGLRSASNNLDRARTNRIIRNAYQRPRKPATAPTPSPKRAAGPTPTPTPTPTPKPTPTPTPKPVEPPKPTPAPNGGPEGWKWDREDRDKDGNLVFAARYNEDGSGKAYHDGETYHLSRTPDGQVYGVNDRTGEVMKPETIAALQGKRERNAQFAVTGAGQREIETMDRSSEPYATAREASSERREAAREAAAARRAAAQNGIPEKIAGAKAIEAPAKGHDGTNADGANPASPQSGPDAPTSGNAPSKAIPLGPAKGDAPNGVIVYHGPRDAEKPPRPNQLREPRDSEPIVIDLRYDPDTDTYTSYDEDDANNS